MENPYQAPYQSSVPVSNRTTITDIDIPFGRLIMIMLKFMLASIPAVLVMYAIMGAIILVLALFFGGMEAFMKAMNAPR